LLVGTVSDVSPGPESFLKITVKAAADLDRLEEVLVITKKVEQAPSVADQGPVRAVDILTDRLPSVPDKPPAASPASASERAASGATAPKPGAKPAASAPHDLKPAAPAGAAAKTGSPPPVAPVKTTHAGETELRAGERTSIACPSLTHLMSRLRCTGSAFRRL
jgi:hypothetical protein